MADTTEMNKGKRVMLTVRINEQLKQQAEERMEPLGLTATEAVNMLYRFIAEHGRMPLMERTYTFDYSGPGEMFNPLEGNAPGSVIDSFDLRAVDADRAKPVPPKRRS